MSIYLIGVIENRRKRVSNEVSWNKKSGVVKSGRTKIGRATSLYQAHGVAISQAKDTKSWFEKLSRERSPFWYNLLNDKRYPQAWFLKGFRGTPYSAETVEVKIQGNQVIITSGSVKQESRKVFGGIETPKYCELVFDLDTVSQSAKNFGRNGCYTLCFEEDCEGTYWEITFCNS